MWWHTFSLFCCVLTISTTTQIAIASPSNNNSPIGVNLGIDELTSAYIAENGDYVTVVRIQTTQAWKNLSMTLYTQDTLNIGKYSESGLKQLLMTELSSVKEATEVKLDRKIDITGVTCPDFLAGYFNILIQAAAQIQPSLKRGAFAWRYLHSIRLAHNLDNAKSLGYLIGTNIDQENNLLLHFDYQNRVLKVSITDVGIQTTNPLRQFLIHHFGGEGQNASPVKIEYLRIRTKRLIDVVLAKQIPDYDPAQPADIRAIIFSGDAPASEFQKIREAIVERFPEFSNRFVDGIEPRWVGSVGAARLARLYKLYPERWDMDAAYELSCGHDEL